MPYYRIVVWTKKRKKPYTGIRFIEQHNINNVYLMVVKKANEKFLNDVKDCEVQMLSKLCSAVKKYVEKNIQK